MIINLLHNAIRAMGPSGTLTVSTASGRLQQFLASHPGINSPLRPDDEVVILRLHDTAAGIPDRQLAKIFDPFFTTKAVGSGTGLGLSVVKKIIEWHGALSAIHNAPQGGLEVTPAFAAAQSGASRLPGKT